MELYNRLLVSKVILLILDQLQNMLRPRTRFSPTTKYLAILLFSIARKAYQTLKEFIILPSERFLQQLSSNFNVDPSHEDNNDTYFRQILATIEPTERNRHMILAIDEIYTEVGLERVGNNNVGMATNKPNELAKTLLAIMVIAPFGT